jgi:hypothetical protein
LRGLAYRLCRCRTANSQPEKELSPPPPVLWTAGRTSEPGRPLMEATMHGLIYLIGLIVVIMAILSFFGLR